MFLSIFGAKIQIRIFVLRIKYEFLRLKLRSIGNKNSRWRKMQGRLLPQRHQIIKELKKNQKSGQFVCKQKPFAMVSHNWCKLFLDGKPAKLHIFPG